jgi:hypothetical protein
MTRRLGSIIKVTQRAVFKQQERSRFPSSAAMVKTLACLLLVLVLVLLDATGLKLRKSSCTARG